MHVQIRIRLLTMALAALVAAHTQAHQVHLGRPLALDDADDAVIKHIEPVEDMGAADAMAEARGGDESVDADEEVPLTPANESRSLGRPQKLLGTAGSSVASDGHQADSVTESGGLFGGVRGDSLQVISALAVVLALVFGLRAAIARSAKLGGAGRPSGVLEVLARYPIARGQHLVLLKMARRILLVHQSGPSMNTLSEMKDPDEVAALLARIEAGSGSPREASRFRTLLNQFTKEHVNASPREDEIKDAWASGEVVDLTKRPRRRFGGLFARSEGKA